MRRLFDRGQVAAAFWHGLQERPGGRDRGSCRLAATLDPAAGSAVSNRTSAQPGERLRSGDSGLETKCEISLGRSTTVKRQLAISPPLKSKFLFDVCSIGDAISVGRFFFVLDANSAHAQMRFPASPPPGDSAICGYETRAARVSMIGPNQSWKPRCDRHDVLNISMYARAARSCTAVITPTPA